MVVNSERDQRNFFRKGNRIPEVCLKLENTLGRQPSDADIVKELGVTAADNPILAKASKQGYTGSGFKIYDIFNRTKPKLLAFQRTYGYGVHRFDVDSKYAYISTEMEGFNGNILVNYDP
jgi:hypothetical protein